jgi:hypothetical protein
MKIAKRGFFWVAGKYVTMRSLNREPGWVEEDGSNEMAENLIEIMFWFF